MMSLINSVAKSVIKRRIKNTEILINQPFETQLKVFRSLINAGRNTEFGRLYDFRSIETPEHFRKRVPAGDYNAIKPFIERQMKGEQFLLWNTPLTWFAKSSGTTGDKSKFIPVSKEALHECHFKGGNDMLAVYIHNHPQTRIFQGKALALGGCLYHNTPYPGSYYGDVSAILMKNLPVWAQFFRSPGLDVALMDKWEEKIEKMAAICMNQNITSISGVPSWMMLLISRIIELKKAENICSVWKNLELFIHGGVSFKPYEIQYKKLIPAFGMNYLETYNSTEGFFGFQDTPDLKEMLLMLDHGIFYEFLPYQVSETNPANAISLEEVKTGINYAPVITTNSGLWRYIIGDTIRFTSLQPYRFVVSGRTRAFINAFGEEVIVENAIRALSHACEKTGAIITDFTAAPIYLGSGKSAAHEWLVEFENPPGDLNEFIYSLDDELKRQNSDYEAKRYRDMILHLPVVHALPPGTFLDWMKRKGKLGGQNKVPKLSNDRIYADEILKIIEENSYPKK